MNREAEELLDQVRIAKLECKVATLQNENAALRRALDDLRTPPWIAKERSPGEDQDKMGK